MEAIYSNRHMLPPAESRLSRAKRIVALPPRRTSDQSIFPLVH
jgi:hypothetical protein